MTKINFYNDRKNKLIRKSATRSVFHESNLQKDPRVEVLKQKLRELINQNQQLIGQITNKGESLRKSLRNVNTRNE